MATDPGALLALLDQPYTPRLSQTMASPIDATHALPAVGIGSGPTLLDRARQAASLLGSAPETGGMLAPPLLGAGPAAVGPALTQAAPPVAAAPPSLEQRTQGVLGRLGHIAARFGSNVREAFTGVNDPRLTDAENAAARHRASLAAATQLLSTVGAPVPIGAALASGAAAGTQASMQAQGRQYQQAQLDAYRQQVARAVQSGQLGVPQLRQLLAQTLAAGDPAHAATAIAAMLKDAETAARPFNVSAQGAVVSPTGQPLYVNPGSPHYTTAGPGATVLQDGQPIYTNPNRPPVEHWAMTNPILGPDGKLHQFKYNTVTGEVVDTGLQRAAPGGASKEPKPEQLVAVDYIDHLFPQLQALAMKADVADFLKGHIPLGEFAQTADYQQLMAISAQIAHNIVVAQGNRFSMQRKNDIQQSMLIRAQDRGETVKKKLDLLQFYIDDLKKHIDAGAQPGGDKGYSPDNPFAH